MFRICSNFHLSQTATKDASIDSTAIDVDSRGLIRCRISIYLTEGRTTIDVALHNACTRVGDTWSLTRLGTHIHYNVAADDRCLTATAAIDVLADRSAGHVYLGIAEHVGCISAAIDVVDGVLSVSRCLHVINLHQRVLVHSRLVAAAIHAAVNLAVVPDCQVCFFDLTECSQVCTCNNVILAFFRNEARSAI